MLIGRYDLWILFLVNVLMNDYSAVIPCIVIKFSVVLCVVEEKDERAKGRDSDSWTSCS